MPNCTEEIQTSKIEFGRLGRRVIEGGFDGGSMTSDAGVMLLGATDRKLRLLQAAASCIADPRSPLLITHSVADMLRQRVYGLALGWEDLNDHGAPCAATWPCRRLSVWIARSPAPPRCAGWTGWRNGPIHLPHGACQRRLNIEPPCRSNIDPGRVAGI